MRRFVSALFILFVILMPLASMSIYMGGSAGANINFYLPYDLYHLFDEFHAKARIPLGGTVLLDLSPFPLALEVGGGYFPEIPIGLDSVDNSVPYYVELLCFYPLNWMENDDETRLREYFGGGAVCWLSDETPVADLIAEFRAVWTPWKHFYLTGAVRGSATFDLVAASEGMAMGFLQMGIGCNVGLGVCF